MVSKGKSQRKDQLTDAIQKAAATRPTVCQTTPTYTDTHQPIDRIPLPQAWRVKTRYVAGQTIRAIARTEHLNRRTVTKLVRGQDVQDYVSGLREQFYGLGDAALDAVKHALIEGKDARLGFEILKSIGVIPTSGQAIQHANQEPMGDEDTRVRETMVKLASCAIERNRVFNTPLPNVDAVEREIEVELQRQNEK